MDDGVAADEPTGEGSPSLRDQAVAGGTHLVVRQVAGLALRSLGLLALTRFIGPGNYGVYVASLAIVNLISSVCRFGTEVYLIRFVGKDVRPVEEQVFSFLLVVSTATVAVGLPAAIVISRLLDIQHVMVLVALLAVVPVNVLWVPAQARLERTLRYRSLASIEFAGDMVLYGVAVAVASAGAGVWAPVAGYVCWQVWLLVASYRAAAWRPAWRWDWSLLRDILRYGASYSPSTWATRLQEIVNPLVVGRFVGAVGVGYVALALRLAENLGFVRRAVNQVAVSALARVQHDRGRVERAHAQAMTVKVIGVGVPLLAVTLAMPVVLPPLVGSDWEGVSDVFPMIAAAALLGGPLTLNAKVLNVVGRNAPVAVALSASVAVLAATSFALVPALGIAGFGWASIVAVAPLLILDRAVRPFLTPRYGPAVRWCVALVPPMFIPLVSGPAAAVLAAPTVLALLHPHSWRDLREMASLLDGVRRRRSTTP